MGRRVRTKQLRRALNSERNSYVLVEGGEVCAICGEGFKADDCMVIYGDGKKVHERCYKETEKEAEAELEVQNDLFWSVCFTN